VQIGGQSDGKSSLLEAFLGFRFNVREVEMGTRRPLIVQMIHDPNAESPACRLQNEDDGNYGPKLPEADVADTLKKRTMDHLASLGNVAVSAKPLCMRVEYAYCPNLTIIDTPGATRFTCGLAEINAARRVLGMEQPRVIQHALMTCASSMQA
jgi:Dynamin family